MVVVRPETRCWSTIALYSVEHNMRHPSGNCGNVNTCILSRSPRWLVLSQDTSLSRHKCFPDQFNPLFRTYIEDETVLQTANPKTFAIGIMMFSILSTNRIIDMQNETPVII